MPSLSTLGFIIGCFHIAAAILTGLAYPKTWIFIWGGAALFGFWADEALNKVNEHESIIDNLKRQLKSKDELLSSLQIKKHTKKEFAEDSLKSKADSVSNLQEQLQVTTFRLKRMNSKK